MLDNNFFDEGKYGQSDRRFQLETLIHEALHAYVGVGNVGKKSDSPSHARVYEWAGKIADVVDNGGIAGIPTNLEEVIRHGDIPRYKRKDE